MFNSIDARARCVTALFLLGCVQLAMAQPSSVGELIAKSKALKTQELQGATPTKSANPSSLKAKTVPQQASQPKLWSITGVDAQLTAVLLYQQKAYTVHSTQLPADVGLWQVTDISDQQVWLTETKAVANKRQVLVLQAPDIDTKLDGYLQALQKNTHQDDGLAHLLSRPPKPQASPLPNTMGSTAGESAAASRSQPTAP